MMDCGKGIIGKGNRAMEWREELAVVAFAPWCPSSGGRITHVRSFPG